MNFFLQGDSGIGKSHLLRKLLKPYRSRIAGYGVQRLYWNQRLVGFRIQQIMQIHEQEFGSLDRYLKEEEEMEIGCSGVFLYQGKRDMAVLENAMDRIVIDREKIGCQLILLDEIGGAELESQYFMETLYSLLKGKKPCVGVFKSAGNLERMAAHGNLASSCLIKHQELEQTIRETGTLLTMTKENRKYCEACLQRFLMELFSENLSSM